MQAVSVLHEAIGASAWQSALGCELDAPAMIITMEFDYVPNRWRFRVRDRENDMIEFDSQYIYTSEDDADAAGHDAIDFSLHQKMMEA